MNIRPFYHAGILIDCPDAVAHCVSKLVHFEGARAFIVDLANAYCHDGDVRKEHIRHACVVASRLRPGYNTHLTSAIESLW